MRIGRCGARSDHESLELVRFTNWPGAHFFRDAGPSDGRTSERRAIAPALGANRGLRFGFGPELWIPTDKGPMGGGLVLDGRYGFMGGIGGALSPIK